MPGFVRARRLSLPLGLLALLLAASCFEQDPVTCWQYEIGALEGYVTVCGEGIGTTVAARSLDSEFYDEIVARTVSDSTTGYYRLELPTGFCDLELGFDPYSHRGDGIDTVTVTRAVTRMDLKRGRAEITVGMPPELESREFNLLLIWRNGPLLDSIYLTASVENGEVRFEKSGLLPRAFVMDLRASGGSFYLPAGGSTAEADSLFVGTDEPAAYEISFADSYASISGEISGCAPELGCNLSLYPFTADSTQAPWFKTTEDDAFTCHFLVPQPIRLATRFYKIWRWFGGDTYETATLFDLQPGDRLTGVDLIDSGLAVHLSGPEGTTAYAASASLVDEAGNTFDMQGLCHDNPLPVCNLRPGRYYLHVTHLYRENQVWAPQWYDGAGLPEHATPIDLTEGECKPIDMRLFTGGSIAGRVLMSGGDKSADARDDDVECALFDENGEKLGPWWWQICVEGEFLFTGLDNGVYYLAARRNADAEWWFSGTHDFSHATPIVIENYEAVTGIQWSFSDSGREAEE